MVSCYRVLSLLALLSSLVSAQTTHTVSASGMDFTPKLLDIQVGDTVHWIKGQAPHTVTEGDGPVPNGTEAFDAVLNNNFPDYLLTFDGRFLFEYPRGGNRYDYYCVPHFNSGMTGFLRVASQWTNLGNPHPGTFGEPFLWAEGSLASGAANLLQLENATPSSLCILFVGLGPSTPVPFKGGLLTAFPFLIQVTLFTSPTGMMPLPFALPPGLSGASLVFQYAIQDSGASNGVALSNAAEGDVP